MSDTKLDCTLPGGPLFERVDAANYLGVSPRTMEMFAAGNIENEEGPPYRVIGRHARYLKSDLDDWLLSRPAVTSRRKAKPRKK